MEKLLEIYTKYKDYILFTILLIIIIITQAFFFWYFTNNINSLKETTKEKVETQQKQIKTSTRNLVVDIKGEIKKPGVYYLEKGKRVIDVVKKAGGLTVYADTSVNNLSKKITDEMVIIIYSKEQIRNYELTQEKEEEILNICNEKIENNSCIEKNNETKTNSNTKNQDNTESSKKLISINTATQEELMTLSGIGESKAKAIIEYRNKKKFETIEELKEISGIGDSIFEKIKDNITI